MKILLAVALGVYALISAIELVKEMTRARRWRANEQYRRHNGGTRRTLPDGREAHVFIYLEPKRVQVVVKFFNKESLLVREISWQEPIG